MSIATEMELINTLCQEIAEETTVERVNEELDYFDEERAMEVYLADAQKFELDYGADDVNGLFYWDI